MTRDAAPGSDDRRGRATGLLAAAAALHGVLLWYFIPGGLLLSNRPIATFDYSLHAYQVDRALAAFRTAGALWSYDPFVLAGQPAGAVEDLTSKSLELFVIAAAALGVRPWVAFDAYVFLVHAAVVPVAFVSSRLLGFTRIAAAASALLWVLLWHFDSFLHWCWYVGMISWGAASLLSVLVVALAHRAVHGGRTRHYAALAIAAAAVTLVHPFAVLTLAVPLGALFATRARALAPREHAMLAAGLVVAASTTLVWIGPALRFRGLIGPVDAFLHPTASYAAFDAMDLMKDVLMTGQPVRTALRSLVLVLAAIGVLRLRRAGDARALTLGLSVVAPMALAYGSGYSAWLLQTQPYRHVGPAALVAALVAAHVVTSELASGTSPGHGATARVALAIAAVAGLPVLARTVVGYVPALLPARSPARAEFRPGPGVLGSTRELSPPIMGHEGPDPEHVAIAEHLTRRPPEGRVAVFDWVLGEHLATFTRVPVLGGIPQRNVPHAAAHPLRHADATRTPEADPLRDYLDTYAVGAVITSGPLGPIDARPDLLEPVDAFGRHRVYRTLRSPTYFAAGEGRVVAQSLDSIRVEGASGSEVVLRFHHLETLRCRPGCAVEKAPVPGDDAGFLRVSSPPPAFEIYNAR